MPKLILVRGLPGSGKSTYAKEYMRTNPTVMHIEADMWFETDEGYKFNPRYLKEAHAWCQNQTYTYLCQGWNVIVSNTFTQKWELDPYLEIAEELDIPVEIITMTGNYENIHNVPEHVINKMKDRWEA